MTLSRRRFLTIASAACLAAPAAAFRWQGIALGARAQIVLDHPRAAEITRASLAEIARLEGIFSLYQPESELQCLNAAGRIAAPSFELLDCLAIARQVHLLTEGRFDPTVQPLWRLLAQVSADGRPAGAAALEEARRAVGFERVIFDSAGVVLGPGQALTLNGIAQGYIADRVARLMRRAGVADVLIDTGEIVAMGAQDGQAGWPVTIAGEAGARTFRNRALATSATLGTVLDAAGAVGHILDPRPGNRVPAADRQISISAPNAALADALSTGLCIADSAVQAQAMLDGLTDVRLEHIHFGPTPG